MISSTTSPWASSVHLVKKKNSSFRLVHDYRLTNKRKKQNYPLPRLTDFTQQIHGATIFSSLDLKSAFWQLDVPPLIDNLRLFALIMVTSCTINFHKV